MSASTHGMYDPPSFICHEYDLLYHKMMSLRIKNKNISKF